MGIMPGRKEGGKERSRRGRSKAPPAAIAAPLSLCEKALRISLACAHTRETRAADGRHVCVPFPACNADFRDFLTGSPSPFFPFSIQDLINAWIQFLRPFKAKDIVSLFLSSVTRGEKGSL